MTNSARLSGVPQGAAPRPMDLQSLLAAFPDAVDPGEVVVDLSKVASWLSVAANVGLLVRMGLDVYEINQNTKLARMALVNEGNVASNQFWASLMGDNPTEVIAMAVECPEMMSYSDFMSMDAYWAPA